MVSVGILGSLDGRSIMAGLLGRSRNGSCRDARDRIRWCSLGLNLLLLVMGSVACASNPVSLSSGSTLQVSSGDSNATESVPTSKSSSTEESAFCMMLISDSAKLAPPSDPFDSRQADLLVRQYKEIYAELAANAPVEVRADIAALNDSVQNAKTSHDLDSFASGPNKGASDRVAAWIRSHCPGRLGGS